MVGFRLARDRWRRPTGTHSPRRCGGIGPGPMGDGLSPVMNMARAPVITGRDITESISSSSHPAVQLLPDRQGPGDMHQRQQEPQRGKASRQVTEGACATMVPSLSVDYVHLVHQLGMGKIGPAAGNFWVVQRQKGETAMPVPSRKALDLAGTESTLSVVDDDVCVGTLAWRGQMGGRGCRRWHTPIDRLFARIRPVVAS
jgi:hypothetical protein